MRLSERHSFKALQAFGTLLLSWCLVVGLPCDKAWADEGIEEDAVVATVGELSSEPLDAPESGIEPSQGDSTADDIVPSGEVADVEQEVAAGDVPFSETPATETIMQDAEPAADSAAETSVDEAGAQANPADGDVPGAVTDDAIAPALETPESPATTEIGVQADDVEDTGLPETPQKAVTVEDGTYVLQSEIGDDRVIQPKAAKSGASLVTAAYKGGAAQQWKVVREGTSLWYRILSAEDDRLALVVSTDAKGNRVVKLTSAKAAAKGALLKMLWSFVNVGKGARQLVNASEPELRLAVEKASKKTGAKVTVEAAKGTSAKSQRVKMLASKPKVAAGSAIDDGSYVFTLNGSTLVAAADVAGKDVDARLKTGDKSLDQRIYLERTEDGYYIAWTLCSGKALGVSGKSILSGTAVRQWTYKGSSRQKWALCKVTARDGSVSYTLQNKATGLYLGATKGKEGTCLVGRAVGETNCSFDLDEAGLLEAGIYSVVPRGAKSIVMQVRKQSTKTAKLVLWSETGSLAQRFELVRAAGADLWRIRTGSSGGWLTWKGSSAVVQMGSGKTAASDKNTWRAVWDKGGVTLVNVAAEKAGNPLALGTNGGKRTKGTAIVAQAPTGDASQHFVFLSSQLLSEGYYFLEDGGLTYLQVKSASLKSGAPLLSATKSGSYGQFYKVEHVGEYVRIKNVYSGKYVQASAAKAGAKVVQRPENSSKKQLWRSTIADGGFVTLASAAKSSLALAVKGGGKKAGSAVVVAKADGTAGQRWKPVTLSSAVNVAKTARQKAVVQACKTTPSPGRGLCAAWVSSVIENAGIGSWNGDACDLYWNWCSSTDLTKLRPGMIVAVSSHSHTAAGKIWGHVAVYVGDGKVMDNVGSIRTMDFYDWIAWYGDVVRPKWGWLGGARLR